MTNIDAIKRADEIRPNSAPEDLKNEWLMTIEQEFCETTNTVFKPAAYPDEMELCMPDAHSMAYVMYMATMIDIYNQDMNVYQNDAMVSNQLVSEAKAWWRRNNPYPVKTEIKV